MFCTQACDGVLPLLVEGVNPELGSRLACQLMAGLDTEEKAGVVFTTSENVSRIFFCIGEYSLVLTILVLRLWRCARVWQNMADVLSRRR